MVQMPSVRPVTVSPFVPLTVQTTVVSELKFTVRSEVAVALAVVVLPTLSEEVEKLIVLIVWLALPTATVTAALAAL